MELAMDSLSVALLAAILVLALVHLVVLRKPEPATHPLILGRQSDVDKVRRVNESPIFLSSTSGLGGLAKQLLKGTKSIHELYQNGNTSAGGQSKQSTIILGVSGKESLLQDKVNAVAELLKAASPGTFELAIRLEDPADSLIMLLAASRAGATQSEPAKAPLVLANAHGLSAYASSPVATSSGELQALQSIPSDRAGGNAGSVILVNSGPQPPNFDPVKYLPSGWNVAKRIDIDHVPVSAVSEKSAGSSLTEKPDIAACLVRMQVASSSAEGVVEVAHRHLLQGGLISLLSMFPPNERPTSTDTILSFESTSTPYGLSVALMCAAVEAKFRLCSPQRGIVSRCKTTSPSIIFCTPNELNAIRAAMTQVLPKDGGGTLFPLAKAYKMSLLKTGSVSKDTFWDSLIFRSLREGVVGSRLRCIVCSAEEGAAPTAEVIDFMRVVLGIPVVVVMTHPLVAGPVTSTLFYDYQRFPSDAANGTNGIVHVGAPSTTVECKLVGVSEEDIKNDLYRGELVIRGPSVLRDLTRAPGSTDVSLPEGWTKTGIWVDLQKNGTLKPVKKL